MSKAALKQEVVPIGSIPEILDGWQMWFINKSDLPTEKFDALRNQDKNILRKIIAILKSIGIRKHNRVPVIMSYESNDVDAGSYSSSDDYLIIYRDPDQAWQTIVGTIAHEIGHAIYNKLPEDQYKNIKANSRSISSFTQYTDPYFSRGEGHSTGNEWFADYVAATVLKEFGLPANTKVGSWEPVTDPQKGISAIRKTVSYQEPGRTANKSAAAFRQKNWWMFRSVQQILGLLGDRQIAVDSMNLPASIKLQLGGVSLNEILKEFLEIMNGRLEQMSPTDRHLFLKTAYNTVKSK